ncbi:MAG: tyrosine-type recombinase/integrase [Bacillota bacterium]
MFSDDRDRPLFLKDSRRRSAWWVLFEEFRLFKRAQGVSERTIRDYYYHIAAFFRQNPSALKSYEVLRKAVLIHFEGFREYSAAYHNLRREYLKAFFNWCVAEGYLEANPVDSIKKRKDEPRPRALDDETVVRLFELCDLKTYQGIRDYALILFQLDTGVRPSEALSLLPLDVNLRSLEARIPARTAKTRTERTVVFSPGTAKAIMRLINVRPRQWDERVPLFAGQDGTRMFTSSWAHRLQFYSRQLGVKITPYQLRHTAAIMMLRGGARAFFVQRQLGHASLSMTQRYVYLLNDDMKEEHARVSPVENFFTDRVRVRNIKERLSRKEVRRDK